LAQNTYILAKKQKNTYILAYIGTFAHTRATHLLGCPYRDATDTKEYVLQDIRYTKEYVLHRQYGICSIVSEKIFAEEIATCLLCEETIGSLKDFCTTYTLRYLLHTSSLTLQNMFLYSTYIELPVASTTRYGVALISRLLKIIGLFCKRAL